MSNQRPDDTWGVERLGKFCFLSQKKLAVDAWRFGHALNLARAKHKSHGDWQKWKKQYVPFLTHSSEHRYRNLAKKLTEDSLDGIGLTEAYRLLALTYTNKQAKDGEKPFQDAPLAVAAEDHKADEDVPDDSDDLAGLPPPNAFHDLPGATGLMEVEAEPEQAQVPTGPLEDDLEAVGEPQSKTVAANAEPSPDERYKLFLLQARGQMEALRSWADWLTRQDEGSRFEMWHKHGDGGIVEEIDLTIDRLRCAKENLAW